MKSELEIVPVRWIDQVLAVALERKPIALTDEEVAAAAAAAAAAVTPAAGDKAQPATGSVKH